jgi:hypothetical protein
MSRTASSLDPRAEPYTEPSIRVGLLIATSSLLLFVTGVAMFEGRVVYRSWHDLVSFAEFATYHARFGRALVPWLPLPLVVTTVLTVALLRFAPRAVPRSAVSVALIGQLVVVGVTGALAIPLQRALSAPGHTPAEVESLVTRLIVVNLWREIPGVLVALLFIWMLWRTVHGTSGTWSSAHRAH